MTKREAIRLLRKAFPNVKGWRHVYPRAYIVATNGNGYAVAAVPWCDAEPHMLGCHQPFVHVYSFRDPFTVGDWCVVGYGRFGAEQGDYAVLVQEARR